MDIQIKTVKLSEIRLNPSNPRRISTQDMEKLCKSVEGFKKMLRYRPIVYDRDRVIIGGNMRFLALKKLGYTEVPETWLRCADDFTDEERLQFIITDNGQFGDWDFDALANSWSDRPLTEWGIDLPEHYVNEELRKEIATEEERNAADRTADEAIEAMTVKIRKIAGDNPKQMGGSIAVIVNNGRGNACLFLADPNTADIVKELKRLADAGEHSPLETLVRSLL